MVKRMIMDFGSASPKLRLSVPGVSVDTATPQQLMLDERVLCAQFILAGFCSNPAPGTSNTQTVTIPNFGFIPVVTVWPRATDGSIVRPSKSAAATLNEPYVVCGLSQPNNTTLQFQFLNDYNVSGAYYQVCRMPKP